MKANILGHDYDIVEEEGMFFNNANYAAHNYMKLRISYDPDMKGSVCNEAIVHELFEAINYWMNTKLEHHQITVLSAALFGILRNNQELTKRLFEKIDTKGETNAAE